VDYWNTSSPSYRWVQIAIDRHKTLPPGPPYGRAMSLLTVAMYDGLVAAWDAKYAYERPRPSVVDPSLTTLVEPPDSPAYPSERAVAAGAASTILAYLFPEEAATYAALAEEAGQAQLLAGVQYPSDVEAGLALGRAVAEKVIERAKQDGSDAVWSGEVPEGEGYWTWEGDSPFTPMAGSWQAWLLSANDQFRPAPPPAYDAPVFEHRLDQNPPLAALVYSALGVGINDAFIACFEAKYTYWTMRPFQLDPAVAPLFPTPNHPSYPAAHGCNSGAGSTILAGFFPAEQATILASGQEAGNSRLWAGIHYQSDIDAGLELGRQVGELVLEHTKAMRQP
jgi:membrane-associated phospholipid phosphatase